MPKLDGWFVGQSSFINASNCPGFDPSNPKHEWLGLLGFKHVVQEEAFEELFECHHICISPVVCFDDAQVCDMKNQKELEDFGYASQQETLLAVQVYTKFFCRSVRSTARLNDIAKVA